MSNNRSTKSLPAYLSHYGMHRAPFAETFEPDMFYADELRSQRLEILLHLTQYGDELLLLIGPDGVGKTTLVRQYMARSPDNWNISMVHAFAMMKDEQLFGAICKGFGFNYEQRHRNVDINNIKRNIESQLAADKTMVLVVDNAHVLPKDTLISLLEIINTRNMSKGTSLHTILVCEPHIKIQLALPELEPWMGVLHQRKLEITAFDVAETGSYLRHRLSTAGMLVAENFLTENTINKIYKLTGGLPEKINHVADQMLFDTTPVIRRDKHHEGGKRFPVMKILFILTLVAALVVGALYFLSKNSTSKSEPLVTTQPLLLPAEKTESPPPRTDAENPQALQELLDTLSTEQEKTEDIIVPGPSSLVKVEKMHAEPSLKDEQWLLAQNPDAYTLQLISGHHKSTILKFLEKHPIEDKKPLAYFFSRKDGKNWHNLVYGNFETRQQANAIRDQLAKNLKDVEPWIRSLESIQIDIYQK